MKRVVLIDLSAIFRKHWHATEHEPQNQAFSRTVADVHEFAGHGDHTAVCIDSPPYKRRDVFPEYKAHREKQPQVMYGQLDATIERLRADGLLVVGAKGYEADDIIATFVARLPADVEVQICSGDKDVLQLVSERCFVVSTNTGVVMRAADVEKKYGVVPKQMPEWLALRGDKSDGIPGVAGVGDVTATKLLQDFGSLKGVFGRISEITKPKALAENLVKAADLLKLSAEKLIPLMTDAPIDVAAVFAERAPAPAAAPSAPPPPDDDEPPVPTDEDAPERVVDPAPAPAAAAVLPAAAAATFEKAKEPEPGNGAGEQAAAATAARAVFPEPVAPKPAQRAPVPPPDPPRLVQPATVLPPFELGLEPKGQAQAWDLAERLYRSKVFVQYPTAEALYAAIITGRELGLPAMASVRAFHVMESKLTMAAWAMVGVVVAKKDVCMYLRCVESNAEKATWETWRVGRDAPEPQYTYTFADAEQAGITGSRPGKGPSNWMKRPVDMLSKTAASKLAREVYPDLLQGIYVPEEFGEVAA